MGCNEMRKSLILMIYAAVLLISLSLIVEAERDNENDRNYGNMIQTVFDNDSGLPSGKANDIEQTSDGIIWIGTYAGLYRYNGTSFQRMKEFESVKNVNCLYADKEGRLWIGTNDNGLSVCINQKIDDVIDVDNGLPANSVRSFVQCSDGEYYAGTSESLAIVSFKDGLSISKIMKDIKGVKKLSADNAGHVSAVTSRGEIYLIRDGEVEQHISAPAGGGQFISSTFDETGHLYAGTSSSHVEVYELKDNSWQLGRIIDCTGMTNINSIFIYNGTRFICADNGIGYLDQGDSFHSINTEEFNNSIDTMLADYQGNLWFSSSRLGLLRLSRSSFANISLMAGLSQTVVNTIESWQGKLYIGTDSGLQVIDEEQLVPAADSLIDIIGDTRTRCIRHDSRNNLWVCTYGKGLFCQSPDGTVTRFADDNGFISNRVRSVLELSDGRIVAGADKGIAFIKDGKVQLTLGSRDGLGNVSVLSMLEHSDGTLLVGTDGAGIFCIKDGVVASRIGRDDGLGSEVILRMVADKDTEGTFIVTGTDVFYMDKDKKLRLLKNVPFYNNFDLILSQGNKVFLTGSAGIYVLDRSRLLSGEDLDYELLDKSYGLVGNLTANAWNYQDASDNLYVGSDIGVMRLNLNDYASQIRSFRLMLSRMKLDNTLYVVNQGETLKVGHDVSRVELFPEILNYTAQNPYVSYYLEGVDKEPIIVKQSELTSVLYTNLPAGEYKFHLNVLSNDKDDVIESAVYTLNKEMEIYDYPLFKLGMVLVLMLIVVWLTRGVERTRLKRTLTKQKNKLMLAKQQVQMANEAILAIARTVDAKDVATSQHSMRVGEYSLLIGKELGLSKEECDNLHQAAIVHDIGKIGIADAVLNKPGRLTDEEYAIMKTHVIKGAEILKDFTLVDHIIEGVLYHHERYDGSGYPKGLKGEEIPLFGRIIAVADVFDAMTANRVYRQKMDIDYVINEMIRGKGKQFDGRFVDILLGLIESKKIDVNRIYKMPDDGPAADLR